MCNCHSYNAGKGENKEVVLENPYSPTKKKVCIDRCITPVIKHLWKNKIPTYGSCCGHGGKYFKKEKRSNIIITDNANKEYVDNVKKLIKEVDDRKFKILSYVLTEV